MMSSSDCRYTGKPRKAVFEQNALHVVLRRVDAEPDHTRPRHHDVGRRQLGELERAGRDLACARMDRPLLLRLVHQLLELVGRHARLGERRLIAEQLEHQIRRCGQQPHQGPRHARQAEQHRSNEQRVGFGVAQRERLRHELAEHERKKRDHDHRRGESHVVGMSAEPADASDQRLQVFGERRAAECAGGGSDAR